MTDRDSPEPDELSEPEVSALLGSLGDAEPLPEDVRSRLDATLAELVGRRQDEASDQDDAHGEDSAAVVPLQARRRRNATLGLLVAAAFLGVVGLGAAVVGGGLSGLLDGADQVTAGDAAESEDPGATGSSEEGPAEESGGGRSESAEQTAPEPSDDVPQGLTATRAVPEVGTDRALRRVVRVTATREAAAYDERDALRDVEGKRGRAAGCVTPRDAGGDPTVAVTYRGDDATLVVRRDADVLEGRVYDCTLGLLLDGVRLSTPEE